MKTITILQCLLLGLVFTVSAQNIVNLGDLKINQPLKLKSEIRSFYKNDLGVDVTSFESPVVRDYLQFDNGLRLNMIYQENSDFVPSVDEFYNGLWIKIVVDNFNARYSRIKSSGATILKDLPEQGELYFQAPGGQVFRMASQ